MWTCMFAASQPLDSIARRHTALTSRSDHEKSTSPLCARDWPSLPAEISGHISTRSAFACCQERNRFSIPILKVQPTFCDHFPCEPRLDFLKSVTSSVDYVWRDMKSFAASQPISVLVADSNRMQAQLLTSALR